MILVISSEQPIEKEHYWIHQLFKKDLDFFHVRKYSFSDDEMKVYLNRIDAVFRHKIVLHSHYHLANDFGIERLHFREESRIKKIFLPYESFMFSTSVHSIEDFNALGEVWHYAFLSPVFPSISKSGYGKNKTVLDDLKCKNNPDVQLIGLGGIDHINYKQVFEYGADGIALLGSIWQSNHPLNAFLKCR